MKEYRSEIAGNLDIVIDGHEDESDGETGEWQDILIHGDPEGLRSLANVLLRIADLNQNDILDLPIGAREHIHLRPKVDLSSSSQQVIIGRLDAKGTGAFYKGYIPK
jgi:hypothetical protein